MADLTCVYLLSLINAWKNIWKILKWLNAEKQGALGVPPCRRAGCSFLCGPAVQLGTLTRSRSIQPAGVGSLRAGGTQTSEGGSAEGRARLQPGGLSEVCAERRGPVPSLEVPSILPASLPLIKEVKVSGEISPGRLLSGSTYSAGWSESLSLEQQGWGRAPATAVSGLYLPGSEQNGLTHVLKREMNTVVDKNHQTFEESLSK